MFTRNRSWWWMQALGLCGALALGGAAGAQTGEPQSGSGQQGQSGTQAGSPQMGMGDADVEARTLTELHQVAKLQEEQAEIAEDKATSPQVRDFARQVKDDAEDLAKKTEDLAKGKDIPLPEQKTKDDPTVKRLESASGEQIDATFVGLIASEDRKVASALDRAASLPDPDLKKLDREYRATLKQHKNMAKALQSGTGKTEPQPPSY